MFRNSKNLYVTLPNNNLKQNMWNIQVLPKYCQRIKQIFVILILKMRSKYMLILNIYFIYKAIHICYIIYMYKQRLTLIKSLYINILLFICIFVRNKSYFLLNKFRKFIFYNWILFHQIQILFFYLIGLIDTQDSKTAVSMIQGIWATGAPGVCNI